MTLSQKILTLGILPIMLSGCYEKKKAQLQELILNQEKEIGSLTEELELLKKKSLQKKKLTLSRKENFLKQNTDLENEILATENELGRSKELTQKLQAADNGYDVVVLKDGKTVRGQIRTYEKGIYTLDTPTGENRAINLGQIKYIDFRKGKIPNS